MAEIVRFFAKIEKLICEYLFITQGYSGKRFTVVKEFNMLSFEICHGFQIDLDKKILRNQNHYISY